MKTAYLLLACLLTVQAFAQKNIYVATNGLNSNDGLTPATAYETIAFAVEQAGAGDKVYVSPGLYSETSEITITRPLSLLKNGTGDVTVDGTSLHNNTVKYFVAIINTPNVTIDGLSFKNYTCDSAKGIWILRQGADAAKDSNISIRNCTFNNIGWIGNNLTAVPGDDATNVIRVEGNSETALFKIYISNNTISNCATGRAEAITVTGNIEGFSLENNNVHEISNIGIDINGNSPYTTSAPANVNQARNGIVSGNTVYNCMSPLKTAAGIYLDGAKSVIVKNNIVHNCGAGISIGAETTITGDMPLSGGHTIFNNILYSNSIKGIVIGASPENVNKPVTAVTLYNNTFYKNATARAINGITTIGGLPLDDISLASIYSGEVMLQNISGLTMQNNIVYPIEAKKGFNALYGYKIANFLSNYNDYYRDDNAPFFEISNNVVSFNGSTSNGGDYNLPANFTAATSLEKNSVNKNPAFTDTATHKFSLTSNSKGIVNKGNPTYSSTLSGSKDIAGNPRLFNYIIDMGAYEYQEPILALEQVQPFNAFEAANGVTLTWQFNGDYTNINFSVERSADATHFTNVGTVQSTPGNSYEWTDNAPLQGWNYYRIKVTKTAGSFLYSAVKNIQYKSGSWLVVYPNPVTNGRFIINTSIVAGTHNTYTVFTMQGKIAATGLLTQATQQVYIPSLSSGAYMLKLSTGQAVKLLVQ